MELVWYVMEYQDDQDLLDYFMAEQIWGNLKISDGFASRKQTASGGCCIWYGEKAKLMANTKYQRLYWFAPKKTHIWNAAAIGVHHLSLWQLHRPD
jgi:hypothetical protein